MNEVLLALGGAAVEVLLVKSGGLLLRAASLGRWRPEPLRSAEHRVHAAAGAFSYRKDGVRTITRQGQTVAGVLAWLLVVFIAVYLFNAA